MAASLVPVVKWGVVGIAAGMLTLGVSERARYLDRSSDGSIDAPAISASDRNPSKLAPVEPVDQAAVPAEIATPTAEASVPPDGPSMAAGDLLRPKLATARAKPRVRASNVTDIARQLERADETAVAPPAAEPPPAAPEGAPRPSLGSLGAEVGLLDEARSALAGHDAARALRAIESYERTFPAGRLLTEATALRIEVFVANHQSAVAKAFG